MLHVIKGGNSWINFVKKLKAGYLECTIRMLHVTVNRRSVEWNRGLSDVKYDVGRHKSCLILRKRSEIKRRRMTYQDRLHVRLEFLIGAQLQPKDGKYPLLLGHLSCDRAEAHKHQRQTPHCQIWREGNTCKNKRRYKRSKVKCVQQIGNIDKETEKIWQFEKQIKAQRTTMICFPKKIFTKRDKNGLFLYETVFTNTFVCFYNSIFKICNKKHASGSCRNPDQLTKITRDLIKY